MKCLLYLVQSSHGQTRQTINKTKHKLTFTQRRTHTYMHAHKHTHTHALFAGSFLKMPSSSLQLIISVFCLNWTTTKQCLFWAGKSEKEGQSKGDGVRLAKPCSMFFFWMFGGCSCVKRNRTTTKQRRETGTCDGTLHLAQCQWAALPLSLPLFFSLC